MVKRKHPAVSVHPVLHGQLEVDWKREYQDEFRCPHCETGRLTGFIYARTNISKLVLKCKSCRKATGLTCKNPGMGYKYLPISTHQTLNGKLQVNWKQKYRGEYQCPSCYQGILKNYYFDKSIHNLALECESCQKYTYLTCKVSAHIYSYDAALECPNPLCTQIGNDGQKGWIYRRGNNPNNCKCYFCGITFNPNSTDSSSWVASQTEEKLIPFYFDNDTWDLANFYDRPYQKLIHFHSIYPEWYRLQVKQYLHYLLRSRVYSSTSGIRQNLVTLKHFGKILEQQEKQQNAEITRELILAFLDTCKSNKNQTICRKLSNLKEFLEWSGKDATYLVRRRDFPKTSNNDPDWLDEVTRQAIKQHLYKIPAPISRHYLVQEFTAARPEDICQMNFDCLVEENGKWHIKFYQHKVSRWHRIPATREIRRVIEEQQQWIRRTFGSDYSFLFCNFRGIRQIAYPSFSNIRPLPQPPQADTEHNPMVRIVRMLIERENIRDANEHRPHFTGKITRSSRLQEVRTKYGIEAARLYADHKSSITTFQNYAPPTREQVAEVDLPFQKLLMNPDNKFLPWQSLPESLLENPKAHELDLEIAPRLVVYGHCALDPKTPCSVNLFPKCYGCSSFCPSTGKLPLYERQYRGEQQRLAEAEKVGAELAQEEAKATIEAMDKWLPELRRLANG